MSAASDWRTQALPAIWAIGGALILWDAADAIINLRDRTLHHDVRSYSELALELAAAFGTIALLQSAMLLGKAKWAAAASRVVSTLVLVITGFWLLMAVATGVSGSLVSTTGYALLLVGSLAGLAVKSTRKA